MLGRERAGYVRIGGISQVLNEARGKYFRKGDASCVNEVTEWRQGKLSIKLNQVQEKVKDSLNQSFSKLLSRILTAGLSR